MLKQFHSKIAQANFGEYALLFLVILGMILAMGIYLRRALQGRIRDARAYMFRTVILRTPPGINIVGKLWVEYEPYYTNTLAFVTRTSDMQSNILSGGSSGIFRELTNEYSAVQVISITAPPMNAR